MNYVSRFLVASLSADLVFCLCKMGKSKENVDPCDQPATISAKRIDIFKVKKVRAPLTVKDKLQVIDMLKSGQSQRKIAIGSTFKSLKCSR